MTDSNKVERDDAWVLEMATAEEGHSVEVGGSYGRLSAANPDASRRSLAQFVELSRRQLGLSSPQLAEKAQIALEDLLTIEVGRGVIRNPESVSRLAAVLGVDAEPLLALAGMNPALDEELGKAAAEFSARLEPVAPLERREQEALGWFKSEALKARRQAATAGRS